MENVKLFLRGPLGEDPYCLYKSTKAEKWGFSPPGQIRFVTMNTEKP